MFETGNQEVARFLSPALGVQDQYIFRHGFRIRGVALVGPMEKAGGASKVTNGMKQKPKFTGDCGVGRALAVSLEKEVGGSVETPFLVALAGLAEGFFGGSHGW